MEIITPVTHDLGDFKVRRVLPARSRTMVGPFIFVDQFGPARLPHSEPMITRALTQVSSISGRSVTASNAGSISSIPSGSASQVCMP